MYTSKDNDELFKAKMHYAKAYVYKSKILKASKKYASKKVSIKLQKVAKSSGYRIQISTDKKFKKNKKTVTIKKNKTSTTVKKLKANKKYYVRVRTYKTVKINGKATKIYSSWSKAKSVTTKK